MPRSAPCARTASASAEVSWHRTFRYVVAFARCRWRHSRPLCSTCGAYDRSPRAHSRPDTHPAQIEVIWKGTLAKLDITRRGILDPASTPQLARLDRVEGKIQPRLDRFLHAVRQFLPAGGKELDAVVFERIVRCRDHHPGLQTQRARQIGHSRLGIGPASAHHAAAVKPASSAASACSRKMRCPANHTVRC